MSFGAPVDMGAGGLYARHRLDLSVNDFLFGILSCDRARSNLAVAL